jgi:hypothetical protein
VFDLTNSRLIGSWQKVMTQGIASRGGHGQLSPDGKLVLLHDGVTMEIVDAASGNTLREIASPDIVEVQHAAFLPKDRLIVFSSTKPGISLESIEKRAFIFNTATGKELFRFERRIGLVRPGICYSPDGEYFVVGASNPTTRRKSIVEVYEISSGEQIGSLDLAQGGLEKGDIHRVAFSPDGRRIAILEQKEREALRLHLVDCGTGELSRSADLLGDLSSQGNTGAFSAPLYWFPNNRYLLIGSTIIVDTTTGRRVWQAQGPMFGNWTLRIPGAGGLLYQVNSNQTTSLETLPIDFARIAAIQSSFPTDAILRPDMTVATSIDLSGAGLQSLNDVVRRGFQRKLELQGFTVEDEADRVLQVRASGEFVDLAWTSGDGSQTYWESVASHLSHALTRLREPQDLFKAQGVAMLLAYPTPWFIAGDGQSTLPIVAHINHKAE